MEITRGDAGKVERVGGGDEKESEDKCFHCCCCAEFLGFVHFRVCFTSIYVVRKMWISPSQLASWIIIVFIASAKFLKSAIFL